MKVSWQSVAIFSVSALVLGALVWKGIVPSETFIGLVAGWVAPSPMRMSPPKKEAK